jgi:hypothetical protein
MNELHIVPLDDYREHECYTDCWCHPSEDDEIDGVFIHHAMDGREAFESGERLMS